MRFYTLTLTPAPTSASPNPSPARVWSSHPGGKYDPGALNVEFDLLETAAAAPVGGSNVTVHGPALEDLLQAANYGAIPLPKGGVRPGYTLKIEGGMKAGLPLANPTQSGLLMEASVQQSFGNWIGIEQNINFVVYPAAYTYAAPGNFVMFWGKGVPLQQALQETLKAVYPDLGVIISISDTYVNNHDRSHVCSTLTQLGQWLQRTTATTNNPGVQLYGPANNTLVILDGTQPAQKVTQLQFVDLVGQPTWVDQLTMQVTTILRADIVPGTTIQLPPGLTSVPGQAAITGAALPSSLRNRMTFTGRFLVTALRHVANYRDPNGTSWITIFQCVPETANAG